MLPYAFPKTIFNELILALLKYNSSISSQFLLCFSYLNILQRVSSKLMYSYSKGIKLISISELFDQRPVANDPTIYIKRLNLLIIFSRLDKKGCIKIHIFRCCYSQVLENLIIQVSSYQQLILFSEGYYRFQKIISSELDYLQNR